jgi:hypothetical protein
MLLFADTDKLDGQSSCVCPGRHQNIFREGAMEKPLPAAVEREIERAHSEMLNNPQHALKPFHRRGIYSAFGPLSDVRTRRVRTSLDLLTTKWVLPIWQVERPDDPWPDHLLRMTEGVLFGEISLEEARVEGDNAWNRLESLEASEGLPEDISISHSALGVLETAIEALLEASGRYSFDSALISSRHTDADIDPWTHDTVLCAVTAYAGGVWDPASDPNKRKEFWEWWLLEAIPEAWHRAQAIGQ